jgi:hypothetical protein
MRLIAWIHVTKIDGMANSPSSLKFILGISFDNRLTCKKKSQVERLLQGFESNSSPNSIIQ